jgi:hypothetical protein
MINTGYGILVGVALYFIGVPNPLLWGIMAALFRYLPYLGIWIAASMPAAVAFAVEPGWVKMPMIFGLYFGIDLLAYNVAEPLLYRNSTGVSPLAILVAALFWTWLWGPVGLLLSTPLTVLVVVVGRYAPNLEFLSIMLSDEPVLQPETRFYQRLLAMDLEEAMAIAVEFLRAKSLEELYDGLFVPALSLAEEDRHRGRLDQRRQRFLFRNTRILVEDLAARAEELAADNRPGSGGRAGSEDLPLNVELVSGNGTVLCLPARDEADEIVALMLAHLLNKRGLSANLVPVRRVIQQPLAELRRGKAQVACILALPPFGYMHAYDLCRRLRRRFSQMKLFAAILTERDVEEVKKRQPPLPADQLASSLTQMVALIVAVASAPRSPAAEPVPSGG